LSKSVASVTSIAEKSPGRSKDKGATST
jgi:hypothetical protein